MRSKQLYIKRAIEASFLKLLDEMPFEKITVKNIVDDCGLTRNTFYNYFEDIYDIVDGLLRSQMCDLIRHAEGEIASASSFAFTRMIRPVSRFAKEHPRAVRHLFCSSKREELMRYFDKALEMTASRLVDSLLGDRPIRAEDRALIVNACRFVMFGFFCQWVENGMQGAAEDALNEVDVLFSHSLQTAIDSAVARSNDSPKE